MVRTSNCEKYHKGTPAGPCALCKKHQPNALYFHLGQGFVASDVAEQIKSENNITDIDCICNACKKRLLRLPKLNKPSQTCRITSCDNNATSIISISEIEHSQWYQCFGYRLESSNSEGVPLCKLHSTAYYNCLRYFKCQNCALQQSLQSVMKITSEKLNQFNAFRSSIDLPSVVIGNKDGCLQICKTCYMKIYRHTPVVGTLFHDVASSSSSTSDDSQLFTPSQKVRDLLVICRNVECLKKDDCLEFSIYRSLLFLGEELSSGKAVLLSVVYRTFGDIFRTSLAPFQHSVVIDAFSKDQLLHRISTFFGDCISVSVIPGNERLGRMIRCSDTDLETCLHRTLFDNDKEISKLNAQIQKAQFVTNTTKATEPNYQIVADDIRERLAAQIKNVVSTRQAYSVEKLDLESLLAQVDPIVWNFILRISMSKDEYKSMYTDMTFSWNTAYMQCRENNQLFKRLFTISSLMYIINERSYSPLHLITAVAIDKYTNSSKECFTLLSRLGLTVSKDTFKRFQTDIVLSEMSRKEKLSCSNFCVVSVDNIDKNTSYSSVNVGEGSRGFHGTSVQHAEPIPDLESIASTDSIITPSPTSHKKSRQVPSTVYESYNTAAQCLTTQHYRGKFPLAIGDFTASDAEKAELNKLNNTIFDYMLAKQCMHNKRPNISLPSLKGVLFANSSKKTAKSNFEMVSILDLPADSKDTMKHVLDLLYSKYQIGSRLDKLVVVGDGKTYAILMNLKTEYGDALNWMLPFIGDWHLLKNTQAPFMKLYLDAGLKNLLALFHQGATLNAVAKASGFDKTNTFLLQAWEAMYRTQLELFLTEQPSSVEDTVVKCLTPSTDHDSTILSEVDLTAVSLALPSFIDKFDTFCKQRSDRDATFRFWNNFTRRDMLAYVGMYISIRSRNFDLRNMCIFNLAPIYFALDRHMYLRLVPHHLAELKGFPPEILDHFHRGAFAVSISGTDYASVAFDEAHEMVINKKVKMAMTTTSMGVLTTQVHSLPFRASALANIQDQLDNSTKQGTITDMSPSVMKTSGDNIQAYMDKMKDSALLVDSVDEQNIRHLFTLSSPSINVSKDLLSYYESGYSDFISYTSCVLLADPDSKKIVRKRRNLKTFTPRKVTVHKQKGEIVDQKLQIACLRRQVAYSKIHGEAVTNLNQVIALPRALCDANGLPLKTNKANSSKVFKQKFPTVFDSKLFFSKPGQLAYIIDGMFIINSSPLASHVTIGNYIRFLYDRWVTSMFRYTKARQMHIVFDDPKRHGLSPKDLERARRDKTRDDEVQFSELTLDTKCPSNWQKFLGVRSQKRLLVNLISEQFLSLGKSLDHRLKLVVAGGFDNDNRDKAFASEKGEVSHCEEYDSTHEEGDTRVWYHAHQTTCDQICIYSPDRDTFHVGMPLVTKMPGKQIIVALNLNNPEYLNLNMLNQSLLTSLDTQALGDQLIHIPLLMQMIYICSGCDYISFFRGFSKMTFMKVFFKQCKFISGDDYMGKLGQFKEHNHLEGLLAFYRLVGCVYFNGNRRAFVNEESPADLFDRIVKDHGGGVEGHIAFIDEIRVKTFPWISSESSWMPTASALKFHWLRCCYVAHLWAHAIDSHCDQLDMTKYGWTVNDGIISIQWDTDENMEKVREYVKYLQQGCKCKTGCNTRRCKCYLSDKACGPGCACKDCTNLPNTNVASSSSDELIEETISDISDDGLSDSDSDLDEE